MVGLWGTVEADAWSRNFNYDEYLNLHQLAGVTQEPISFDGYQSLMELFDLLYEDSLK